MQNPNASVICANDTEYWVDNCGDQGAKKADCVCGCNDQAGHKTSQNVEVSLICNTNTSFAVCNGQCADLNSDQNHCGACDTPVVDPLDPYAYCADRQKACSYYFDLCDGNTDCLDVISDPYNCGQCNRNCFDYSADGAGLASAACDGSQYLGTCTGIAQISEAISCQQLCSRLGMSVDFEEVCVNDDWSEYGCVYYVGGYVDRLISSDEIPSVGEGDWALSFIQCACQDRL